MLKNGAVFRWRYPVDGHLPEGKLDSGGYCDPCPESCDGQALRALGRAAASVLHNGGAIAILPDAVQPPTKKSATA
jgi:hypothetical protein